MNETSSTVVHQRARWAVTEVIPLLIFAALGILGIILWVGQIGNPLAGAVLAVVAFGVMLWIFLVSQRRKKNSTLHAKFDTTDSRNLHVWMTKPRADIWGNRLDEGRNKAPLAEAARVEYKLYSKTPAFQFTTSAGKILTLPKRILEEPQVYTFVKETVESIAPLRFKDTESAEQFAGYIGTGRLNPVDVAPVAIIHPDAKADTFHLRGKAPVSNDVSAPAAPAAPEVEDDRLQVIVEESVAPAAQKEEEATSEKPITYLTYEAYRVTPADTIADDAGTSMLVAGLDPVEDDIEADAHEDDTSWSAGSLLLGDSISSTSLPSDSQK